MGSGMPEIGSRISLISKADIRYEGKLFSIDPEECTIALSSVRSYGTEERQTSFPVPSQQQVYDYILFRGTDIKDIVVLTTTIPNDPAIVQLSVPPSLSDSQFVKSHISGYPQPPLVAMGMPNAPSTSKDHPQTFQNSFAGASSRDSILKPQSVQHVASEDESGSSSPSQNVKNTHVDVNGRVSGGSTKDEQNHMSQRRPANFNRDKPMGNNRYQQQQQPPRQQQQQQQRYQPQNRYPQQQQQQQQRYMPQQQQQQYRDYNRDNQYRNYNDYRESYGPRQYVQPLRNNQRAENWNSYGQRRNNIRLGQNGQPQNSYQSAGYQNPNRKPKNTLKFEDDYDFEQANTEFEQMRTQLEKIKLEESAAAQMNGDVDCKKEESQAEVTVISHEVVAEENEGDEDKPIFYDKVRSFFDKISYEAIERSKGVTARVDWKTERKINSETFGQLALRRNSNFHGRSGGNQGYYNYQNRNPAMMNSYRNNNNNNRFNRQQNNQPRKQYSTVVKSHEAGKENRSS